MAERGAASRRSAPPAGDLAWLSVHLGLSGGLHGEPCDRLLLDGLAPLVRRGRRRGWVRRFFFVRYTVGGPHLRVRLLGPPRCAEEHLWPALRSLAGEAPEVVAAERVAYEPEVERYGGTAAALAVSEDLFDASSRAALGLLSKLPPGRRPARLGKGLLALLAGLSAFIGERDAAAAVMRGYGSAYLRRLMPEEAAAESWGGRFQAGYRRQAEVLEPYADAAWSALTAPDGDLPAELAAYRADLVRVRRRLRRLFDRGALYVSRPPGEPPRRATDWADGIRGWLLSQLHMTSNRLGVTVVEETYLALAAAAALAPAARRSA